MTDLTDSLDLETVQGGAVTVTKAADGGLQLVVNTETVDLAPDQVDALARLVAPPENVAPPAAGDQVDPDQVPHDFAPGSAAARLLSGSFFRHLFPVERPAEEPAPEPAPDQDRPGQEEEAQHGHHHQDALHPRPTGTPSA